MNKLNLKELEKSMWKASFQSGIVDFAIFLIIMNSFIYQIFHEIRFYFIWLYALPLLFIYLMKKHVVQPRLGWVQFGEQRRKKNASFFTIMTAFLIIMIALTVLLRDLMFSILSVSTLVVAVLIFFIFALNAYFLSIERFYFYGVLLTTAFCVDEVFRQLPSMHYLIGYAYLLPTMCIFVTSVVLYTRFIKKYPIGKERQYDEK